MRIQCDRSLQKLCNTFVVLAATLSFALAGAEPLVAQTENTNTTVRVPLKIMSFNIRYGAAKDGDNHWNNRSYLVAETIRMFDPDLLGAQEVLKFQAEFLKQTLPDFTFHGVGRQDGTEEGEFVPLMYRNDRFSLVESGHFWLSETPEIAGSKSWDSALPRMASWVQLKDLRNDDAEFVFINTHFDHKGVDARLQSAKLIRRYVDRFMAKGLPVVITGDFNTSEDGKPYASLVKAASAEDVTVLDSYRQAHPERQKDEDTFCRWTGWREGNRIDWILHTSQFTTLQSVINYTNDKGRYPSDHYPVQAILRLAD